MAAVTVRVWMYCGQLPKLCSTAMENPSSSIDAIAAGTVSLLLLVNADAADRSFHLPAGVWQVLLDSSEPKDRAELHWRIAAPVSALVLLLLAVLMNNTFRKMALSYSSKKKGAKT